MTVLVNIEYLLTLTLNERRFYAQKNPVVIIIIIIIIIVIIVIIIISYDVSVDYWRSLISEAARN
jgi:uncharacterized protein (DUF983 family)